MGKIITGQELINIFKGCCSGQTQSFTDAAYIEGIQESMGLSNVENSGRCPAFNGNIDTVFDPTIFWNQMYGGDTGYDFVGSYQLDWTSGYLGLVDTQLVDSTYVPSFQSQMLCTNLRHKDDFTFGLYTDGDYYGSFRIRVYIYFGSQRVLIGYYNTTLSSGDIDPYCISDDITDVVFAGSSNIPSDSGTYVYGVEVEWETGSDGTHNITNLGCDVYGDSGLMSGSITGCGSNEDGGGSFSFMGQATFADIMSINTVNINGEWENGGGSSPSDVYTTIRLTDCYLKTNATSVVYVTGATSASTIYQKNVYLYSTNLATTSVPVYIVDEDIVDGNEIGVQFPYQNIGIYSGSYLLPLYLKYGLYSYTLYVPVTVTSNGNVNLRSSECYLDLASVSYNTNVSYRQVYNQSTGQVVFRPLTSSGVPSKNLSNGSNTQCAPLLSTTHVYPTNRGVTVKVNYNTNTSTTSMSQATVATGAVNTTVNLLPSIFSGYGLHGIIQRIGKAASNFTVYFS